MADVAYHISYIVGLVLTALIVHTFYATIMSRGSWSVVACGAVYIGVVAVLGVVHCFVDGLVLNALLMLALVAIASMLYRSSWGSRVASTMVVYMAIVLAELIVAMWVEYGVYLQPAEDTNYIVGMIIAKVAVYVVVRIFASQYHSNASGGCRNAILVAFVCYIVATFASNTAIIYITQDLDIEALLLIVANVLLVTVFYAYARQLNIQYTSHTQAVAQSHQQEQAQTVIDCQQVADSARHNFCNQLYAIRTLLTIDTEQGVAEIDRVLELQHSASALPSTGIDALDALIAGKSAIMTRGNIQLRCTSYIVGLGAIDSMDMCVIVGNLLDNAIEATVQCQQEGVIELHMASIANTITVHVSNRYVHSIAVSGDQLLSTKANGSQHGYGLSSVKALAHKYGGAVSIDYSSNTFTVDVVLVS